MTVGDTGSGAATADGASSGESFGYGGRSLDELRGLAGSVDTGRIADTQMDFARIAQQMDDVVSQLVAMQSRIPSWWRGASADEAVAKFSEVVNHAQTAYTMADGAGRALSTCVNVVAEQQSAMANVPEVEAPTSGFTAAELFAGGPSVAQLAASVQQGQQYGAAHGRAVEIVNGIAAQFAETTAQLEVLSGTTTDESFRTTMPVTPKTGSLLPKKVARADRYDVRQSLKSDNYVVPNNDLPLPSNHNAPSSRSTSRSLDPTSRPTLAIGQDLEIPHGNQALYDEGHQRKPASFATPESSVAAYQPSPTSLANPSRSQSSSYESNPEHGLHLARPEGLPSQASSESFLRRDSDGRIRFSSGRDAELAQIINTLDATALGDQNPLTPRPTASMDAELSRQMNQVGFGALTSAPHVMHNDHSRIDRGRRPEYLKAPRHAWLTEDIAAPSDGILTIDWETRH